MATLLSVFVLGLSFGLILFLLAAGMTLTMGLMRIVNMAHGALYMVGGYVGIAVANSTHNFWLALIAGAAVTGLVGLGLETGFLRRLYNDEASQVLLTIGFIYIFQNITQWIWGTYPLGAPVPKFLEKAVPVGSIELPAYRFFLIGFGLLMAFVLWRFQDRTRIGSWVRAGMDNREITGTFGINLKVLFTAIFALGSLIAGMCGVLGAPVTGMNLGIGWGALLLSLIVVVIGGTGSIQGALLGGVIIGLLNAFGGAYFPSYADYVVYIALIVILLARPSGLLGRKHDTRTGENLEKASTAKGGSQFASASARQIPFTGWRRLAYRFVPYLIAIAALLLLPQLVTPYYQEMLSKVLIFAIFAMSLDLVMGFTGLISFGWAAFFGISGYSVGILTTHYGLTSFWLVLAVSLLITAGLAAGIGYLSLRVSGVYFLLVTMAFAQLLVIVATKWYGMTGGRDGLFGIPDPNLGFIWIDWSDHLETYYFILAFFVVCYLILNRITRSSFGRTLVGIRANEPRMRSLGYNTWALKYVALIVGGVFAGVAGALFAFDYQTMTPDYFALEISALPMLMVIIGGAASLWGPSLGAAVIIIAETVASIYFEERWPLVLGIIFVVCVMFLKGGFARHLTNLWNLAWGVDRVRKAPAAGDMPASIVKEVET